MDTHKSALEALCRICPKRVLKWRQTRTQQKIPVIKYQEKIIVKYNVDVSADDAEIHPKHICKSCVTLLNGNSQKPLAKWKPHGANCKTCQIFNIKGRPPNHGKQSAQKRLENKTTQRDKQEFDDACGLILDKQTVYIAPNRHICHKVTIGHVNIWHNTAANWEICKCIKMVHCMWRLYSNINNMWRTK